MYYSNRNRKNASAPLIKTVCAIVFLLFVSIYLFFYQEDTLALAQYVLSGGATVYSRIIGGIIITVILALLQFSVAKLMLRKPLCIYALSCFPSLYLLAMLTDFAPSHSLSAWGWWAILMPVVAAIWWIIGYFLGEMLRYRFPDNNNEEGYLVRTLGCNIFLLAAMMICVGLMSNSNDVTHYRLKMERLLMHGKYAQALEVGKASDKSDANLTMLRVFALAHEGRLGDELFKYPVRGTSASIVPQLAESKMLMLSPDSVYRLLGAIPRKGQTTINYLNAIVKSGQATKAAIEYLLCGMLIDKNLDGFVSLLMKTHKIDDNLPLHYREALILYTHRRSSPKVVYRNTVMDTDYNDMQRLERETQTPGERRIKVYQQFFGTYWEYFDYDYSSRIPYDVYTLVPRSIRRNGMRVWTPTCRIQVLRNGSDC